MLGGYDVQLWADDSLLKNPVAFAFDGAGRVYVAETFRVGKGALDNRDRARWPYDKRLSADALAAARASVMDHEIGSRTVAHRAAFVARYLDPWAMSARGERLSRLEDTNGDGRADRTRVFASGFRDALDGVAAGVLVHKGDVFFANIPHLWRLRDRDGDGMAEERASLHGAGYGVRAAFFGHDLHGLRLGPDGRLYFSIGDRGAHLEVEGRTLAYPETGVVFRCELDGSRLEAYAWGLRNPQDLVFDENGNLFTGDNNSDGGDKARWVHVVEGGDSGWRVGYQYLEGEYSRGPWNAEKLWHTAHAGQAAYVVPPVAHIGSGPAGITYDPGSGLDPAQRRRFFMTDFVGQPSASGVWSFSLEPRGASFELRDRREFLTGIAATDVKVGPDGGLYVLDWLVGWNKPGKGRIWRVVHAGAANDPVIASTRGLLGAGMSGRNEDELSRLLAHVDMRVRLDAQLELASRGARSALEAAAQRGTPLVVRLHGVWGLGQLLRRGAIGVQAILPLLDDPEAEVRGQAARVLGDAAIAGAAEPLRKRLEDRSPRVASFAAVALGRIGDAGAVPALAALLRRNGDADPFVRHAAVMGLAGAGVEPLRALAADPSPAVRRGVLLALRRLHSPEVKAFLRDGDRALVLEAARAIHDDALDAVAPDLAALTVPVRPDPALVRRILAANLRIGTPAAADRVLAVAARSDLAAAVRAEAITTMAAWRSPEMADRVTGGWHPLPGGRQPEAAPRALESAFATLAAGSAPPEVRIAALRAAGKLKLSSVAGAVQSMRTAREAPVRAHAIETLVALGGPDLSTALAAARADRDAGVRTIALRATIEAEPAVALPSVARAMASGSLTERQVAVQGLARLPGAEVDALLGRWLDEALQGRLAGEVLLEVLEAASRRTDPAVKAKLAAIEARRPAEGAERYREALTGGSAPKGRHVVFDKGEVACLKCHSVDGVGGNAGPDLRGVGARHDRKSLLEAIVAPSRTMARGWESVILTLRDGSIQAGVLRKETASTLELVTPEGTPVVVRKAQIKARERGASAMPEGFGDILSRRELRDLVEYLSTLR